MNGFPVRIYAANVNVLKDEQLFQTAYRNVTEERRQKVDHMASPASRRLSLGVELLLLYGLAQLGASEGDGQKPGRGTSDPEGLRWRKDIRYRYGENHKPYLEGMDGIYFNLSHSGEMAVCALAPCEVGCDVERIREHKLTIAKRFFMPEEYEMIAAVPDEESRKKLFCRIWTVKESFLKVTGQGMKLGLDCFQIIPEKDRISLIQTVDQNRYHVREYEVGAGYQCVVCCAYGDFEDQVRQVDILKNILRILK